MDHRFNGQATFVVASTVKLMSVELVKLKLAGPLGARFMPVRIPGPAGL